MQGLYKSGTYLVAITIIAFGIITFINGHFMAGFFPISETVPLRIFLLYFISTFFLVCGISMLYHQTRFPAALAVAILLLFGAITVHLVLLFADLHNPGPWTGIAEMLGVCGGTCMIAGISAGDSVVKTNTKIRNKLFHAGRSLFALTLIIFAVQHFMYADFIATLIPHWIPFPVFWAYFVGIAFSAACISILTNIKTQLACTLLGFMFLFWFLFLHLPRVIANPGKESEWTSWFIALAYAGIFFIIAFQSQSVKSKA